MNGKRRNGKGKREGNTYSRANGKSAKDFEKREDKFDDTKSRRNSNSRGVGNDPSWYNKFPELVSVATNLSWNVSLGSPITLTPEVEQSGTPYPADYVSSKPSKELGIMVSHFIPCFGVGISLTDPVNKCALEMYSQLRFNKSGSPGYDPADILMMLQAMDSVYMAIAMGKRIYGVLNIASPVNRYFPKILCEALGFDFDDMLRNKADLNYFLNTLVVQAAKINVPLGMTVTDRHDFLCSNVFKDEDTARASIFAYSPEFLWQYNEVEARLDPYKINTGSLWTYNDYVTMCTSLMDHVERVEDFYTMNANILAAYDYSGLHRLVGVDPAWSTIPIPRTEMLIQLHNSVYCGTSYTEESMRITQNKTEGSPDLGALQFTPSFAMANPYPAYEQIFDIPFENPSTDDIMEATRFKVAGKITNIGAGLNTSVEVTSAGTEILTDAVGYYYGSSDRSEWSVKSIPLMNSGSYASSAAYAKFASKMNMAPLLPIFGSYQFEGQNRGYIDGFVGDVTNYAVVDGDNLSNMHQAALFSQLAITRTNLG